MTARIARTLVAIALAVAMLLPQSAHAQDIDQDNGQVVIDGLNGPQGVLVDDDGSVWAIDTGLGGDEVIDILNTESGQMVEARFGPSAQIVRVDGDGDRAVVANLASVVTDETGYGGARLVRIGDRLLASVGEWAVPDTPKPDGLAMIATIAPDGTVTELADTWAHELAEDPFPRGTSHSHPYGMAVAPDGRILYADAGGNALMAVDPDTGKIDTVTAFEPLPGVFPRPDYGGEALTDPVPTAVVVMDGRVFVSLLSGAPFVPGSAKVVEVLDDGSVIDIATGLTMLTDLAEGPDGLLYGTQFAVFGERGPDPTSGAVVRIALDGSSEPVLEGLPFVTAIDFGPDGTAYVATNGVGPPGSGSVVAFGGVAAEEVAGVQQLPATGSTTAALVIVAVALLAGGFLLRRFRPAL